MTKVTNAPFQELWSFHPGDRCVVRARLAIDGPLYSVSITRSLGAHNGIHDDAAFEDVGLRVALALNAAGRSETYVELSTFTEGLDAANALDDWIDRI